MSAPLGSLAGQQIFTLALIAAILVCTLGFHLPIGFVALSAGLLLASVNIKEHKTFIGGVSWSTVLLVAGMITYVSLLQHVGVIDTLAEMALALGAPLLIALVLCHVIGVGSAFASSTALLTAFIPMAGPLLATRSSDFPPRRQVIGLTYDWMNSTSAFSRPYLVYSC